MTVFNCLPDSVMAYVIEKTVIWEHDVKRPQWSINIWWADGRDTELRLTNEEDVAVIAGKLERTVREVPAVSGFTT